MAATAPSRSRRPYHAQNLYEPFEQAVVNYGLPVRDDYNGADTEGISRIELFVGGGERQSTSRAYLHPVMSRPNLTVETGALTTRLLIEKGRAVGIEYTRGGQLSRVHAEREVILSGGSYNSPQLLMLSGIGPGGSSRIGRHRARARPAGRWAKSLRASQHVAHVQGEEARHVSQSAAPRPRDRRRGRAGICSSSGPFATNGSAAVVFLRSSRTWSGRTCSLSVPRSPMMRHLWFPAVTAPPVHSFTARVGTLYPRSRGWVKLRSADPTDKPRIFFNLFGERADIDDMIRALRIAREIYNTEPQKGLIGEEMTPGEARQDRRRARTGDPPAWP